MTFGGYPSQSESILCASHFHTTNMAASVHVTAKIGFGTGTNELYDRYATIEVCLIIGQELILNVNQGTAILPIECNLAHSPGR